jgi:hypothetical protein
VSGNDLSGQVVPSSWTNTNHPLAGVLTTLLLANNRFNSTLNTWIGTAMLNLQVRGRTRVLGSGRGVWGSEHALCLATPGQAQRCQTAEAQR